MFAGEFRHFWPSGTAILFRPFAPIPDARRVMEQTRVQGLKNGVVLKAIALLCAELPEFLHARRVVARIVEQGAEPRQPSVGCRDPVYERRILQGADTLLPGRVSVGGCMQDVERNAA